MAWWLNSPCIAVLKLWLCPYPQYSLYISMLTWEIVLVIWGPVVCKNKPDYVDIIVFAHFRSDVPISIMCINGISMIDEWIFVQPSFTCFFCYASGPGPIGQGTFQNSSQFMAWYEIVSHRQDMLTIIMYIDNSEHEMWKCLGYGLSLAVPRLWPGYSLFWLIIFER